MTKIYVRSPYIISINETGQTGSRVELFVWNRDEFPPLTPNYTFTKDIVSTTQTENVYNISNAVREYIKMIVPAPQLSFGIEDPKTFCFAKVKRYYKDDTGEFILIDEQTFACLEGYTNFLNGVNQYDLRPFIPLYNEAIKIYKDEVSINYLNAWFDIGTYKYQTPFGTITLSIVENGIYKLPYTSAGIYRITEGSSPFEILSEIHVETICEAKYTPLNCAFINRFGGWSFLTFFKANQKSIDVKSNTFNLMPQNWQYDTYIGTSKSFNFSGSQKITCNTGWVDENYFELIQDLMVSETILLDNIPVLCKTQSTDFKTQLKEKNINYTINFEYNFNLINDVI
jgi:hypothetical protein